MGEIQRSRRARGKRVIEVAPVEHRRDPASVVSLSIRLGSGGESTTALLDDNERRWLIEALGGRIPPDLDYDEDGE